MIPFKYISLEDLTRAHEIIKEELNDKYADLERQYSDEDKESLSAYYHELEDVFEDLSIYLGLEGEY